MSIPTTTLSFKFDGPLDYEDGTISEVAFQTPELGTFAYGELQREKKIRLHDSLSKRDVFVNEIVLPLAAAQNLNIVIKIQLFVHSPADTPRFFTQTLEVDTSAPPQNGINYIVLLQNCHKHGPSVFTYNQKLADTHFLMFLCSTCVDSIPN